MWLIACDELATRLQMNGDQSKGYTGVQLHITAGRYLNQKE